jgi:hypothetical protein
MIAARAQRGRALAEAQPSGSALVQVGDRGRCRVPGLVVE